MSWRGYWWLWRHRRHGRCQTTIIGHWWLAKCPCGQSYARLSAPDLTGAALDNDQIDYIEEWLR